jgi:predicted transposase YdaD
MADTILGIRGIEESSVYQGIFAKGGAEGEAEGRAKEARENLIRQGRRKLGEPDERVLAQLAAMKDLDRLHVLSDRVLEVSSWDELLSAPTSSP